jgi:histidinol-phosphate phosphatase family protein
MSNTRSSRLGSSRSAHHIAVREIVAERAGHEWCLFLDRDGVLNRQVVGDYVRSWRDFEWLPGAPRALKKLREWTPHLVIVTNQQGVGKGLMSSDDLAAIHEDLQAELAADGVPIDAFQVCPHLESAACACRKPRPGLVLDWLEQHPGVAPALSIMVGDSQSDVELAHNVAAVTGGCASIQIGGRATIGGVADATFDSLWHFAVEVGHVRREQGI